MEMSAAVFRKMHEPLTIEQVDIDKPWGREVLVRTVATGVCHSDLHVVDGQGRFPLDRPFVLGHEGAGVVEAVGADVTSMRVGDHVVACLSGFCGTCPQCLSGHPNVCTGGIVARAENVDAARVAERPAVPDFRRDRQLRRTYAAAREFAGADRAGDPAGSCRAGGLRRADRRRCRTAQRGIAGGADGGGVRLRRRRTVDRARRADRRCAADHRGGSVRFQTGDGEGCRRDTHGEQHAG